MCEENPVQVVSTAQGEGMADEPEEAFSVYSSHV